MVAPASSAENNAGQSERSALPTSSSNETGTLVQALSSEPTPPPPELPACVRELGEEVWATASGGHNSPVSSVWKDQEAAADLLRAVTAAAEANPVSFEHWVLLCAATAMFEREFLNGDNILSRAQVRSPLQRREWHANADTFFSAFALSLATHFSHVTAVNASGVRLALNLA